MPSDTPWVVVQNPEVDRTTCAIRDSSGSHIAYMAIHDALRIVAAINGKPASVFHPNSFRAKANGS